MISYTFLVFGRESLLYIFERNRPHKNRLQPHVTIPVAIPEKKIEKKIPLKALVVGRLALAETTTGYTLINPLLVQFTGSS